MFINNKDSVKGLFKFSNNAYYESGDFILDSTGKLYTCKLSDGLDKIKIDSESDLTKENGFYPYLLDNVADFLDYLKETNNNVYSDKLITLNTLQSILNYYNTGLTNKGIIGGYFNLISGSIVTSNVYETTLDINNCLWLLMNDSNINNGIFKVSRKLPEILVYVGTTDTSDTWCILRQYTFELDSKTYRVLELIDPINPKLLFRSCILGESTKTNFEYVYIDSNEYLSRLQYAVDLTNARLNEIEDTKINLLNSFRFKEVSIEEIDNISYIKDASLENIYTFQISSINSPIESYNIIVDASLLNTSEIKYKITQSANLILNLQDNNIKLLIDSDNYIISSIYYRQYFS